MSNILSEQDHQDFQQKGYVKVPEAFHRDDARALEDAIWKRLSMSGARCDAPQTWTVRPNVKSVARSADQSLRDSRLLGAISELMGGKGCARPRDWGRVLFTWPDTSDEPWQLPVRLWHTDHGLQNSVGELNKVFVFSFISMVEPRGGGTLVVEGSHHLARKYWASLTEQQLSRRAKLIRNEFNRSYAWMAELSGQGGDQGNRIERFMETVTEVDGVPCRVVELTGEPGDAFICHPVLSHASSPNRGSNPRMMRAKGVTRKGHKEEDEDV